MDRVDVAVIGGGVIGLAAARSLALAGREVLLLEAERNTGSHTSSRNSEVIHAGLYYREGSLKARLCVAGKAALYAYCAEHAVAHRTLGKLIVATCDDERPRLAELQARAVANGVRDLRPLHAGEVSRLEPAVQAVAGLFSPSTGIVDSHGFMASLRRDLLSAGAELVTSAPVLGGRVRADGIELTVGGRQQTRLLCRGVINAAGLWAPALARSISGLDARHVPSAYLAKGHYFALRGASPFRHLVYPVPVPGGLGTHVTLDLSGRARFGPDVTLVDRVDYGFDESRAASFYAAIRRYYPELEDGALLPAYTGIRAKLGAPGSESDFVVQGPIDHGVTGLVNLFGMESPGLTAALSLAEHITALLRA